MAPIVCIPFSFLTEGNLARQKFRRQAVWLDDWPTLAVIVRLSIHIGHFKRGSLLTTLH